MNQKHFNQHYLQLVAVDTKVGPTVAFHCSLDKTLKSTQFQMTHHSYKNLLLTTFLCNVSKDTLTQKTLTVH